MNNPLELVTPTRGRRTGGYTLRVPSGAALRSLVLGTVLMVSALAPAQTRPVAGPTDVPVTIKTIANFRGAVASQIQGFGLVVGLAGTGDGKKFLQTQKAVVNLLRSADMEVDPTQSETKNVALVALTAELPPYPRPGARIDVTVSTIGDSTSLRGGTLLYANLRAPGEAEVIATVSGSLTVGGFAISAGGNSQSKGFTTVGTMPGAGIVQKGRLMKTVFDGKMYLDLVDADATTAQRVENAIDRKYPELHAFAYDASTVQVDLPAGASETMVQAKLFALEVLAPSQAKVVIDERTGTIVIGGDVRVGPCVVAHGGLTIRVTAQPFVSQPAPLSKGETVVGVQKTLEAGEETAEFAAIRSNTSISDLGAIFQSMRLKASDVLDILIAMRREGALKARVEVR